MKERAKPISASPRRAPASSPPNHPENFSAYTAVSAQTETAVGHRGWARQRTPTLSALRDDSGQARPALCSSRQKSLEKKAFPPTFSFPTPETATLFVLPLPPACGRRNGEAARRNQGGAGGIISPACLSCLFRLFCLSRLSGGRGSAPRLLAGPFLFPGGGAPPCSFRVSSSFPRASPAAFPVQVRKRPAAECSAVGRWVWFSVASLSGAFGFQASGVGAIRLRSTRSGRGRRRLRRRTAVRAGRRR